MADAGDNGVFNANGTVVLGDLWLKTNGSVVYYGHAGSRNGPYCFGFAMDNSRKTVCSFSSCFTIGVSANLWGSILTKLV